MKNRIALLALFPVRRRYFRYMQSVVVVAAGTKAHRGRLGHTQ